MRGVSGVESGADGVRYVRRETVEPGRRVRVSEQRGAREGDSGIIVNKSTSKQTPLINTPPTRPLATSHYHYLTC
jgi:hypothetical protein